jgi:hypothetical protein
MEHGVFLDRSRIAMPNQRERFTSFIASLILCTCLASSISLIVRDTFKNDDLRAGVRPAIVSVYTKSRTSAVERDKISQTERRPTGKLMGFASSVVKSAVKSPDVEGMAVAFRLGAPRSITLIGLTIVTVTATALAAVGVLLLRSSRTAASAVAIVPQDTSSASAGFIDVDLEGRNSAHVDNRRVPLSTSSLGEERNSVSMLLEGKSI